MTFCVLIKRHLFSVLISVFVCFYSMYERELNYFAS